MATYTLKQIQEMAKSSTPTPLGQKQGTYTLQDIQQISGQKTTPVSNLGKSQSSGGGFLQGAMDVGKSIYQGIGNPIASFAYTAASALKDVTTGKKLPLQSEAPLGLGTVKRATNFGEFAGQTIKAGSIGLSPAKGAMAFALGEGIEKGKSPLQTGVDVALAGAFGKVTDIGFQAASALLGKAGGFLREAGLGSTQLKESATKEYAQVLGATTRENKAITAKIAPKMVEKKITASTRSGLLSKAEQMTQEVGTTLETAYNALPQDTQVAIHPILSSITERQNKLVVKGTDVIPKVNQVKFKTLSNLKQELMDIAQGANISLATLRNYRQQLDGFLDSTGKFLTGSETAQKNATKIVAGNIRNELAKQFPDIAKINNEFTFWKRMSDVLKATQERTQAQATPLGQKIMRGIGTGVGFASGGVSGAISYGLAMQQLEKLMTSTAWKTVSAANKSKIADFLAKGETGSAKKLIEGVMKTVGFTAQGLGLGAKGVVKIPGLGTYLGGKTTQTTSQIGAQ